MLREARGAERRYARMIARHDIMMRMLRQRRAGLGASHDANTPYDVMPPARCYDDDAEDVSRR